MICPPGLVWNSAANVRRDSFGQVEVDAIENLRVRFIYNRVVAMIELEREAVDEMLLLVGGQRVEEELGLVIMLLKFLPADPFLYTFNLRRMATKRYPRARVLDDSSRIISTVLRQDWWKDLFSIGPIIDSARRNTMSHLPVTLMVENWAERPINGKLLLVERACYHSHNILT